MLFVQLLQSLKEIVSHIVVSQIPCLFILQTRSLVSLVRSGSTELLYNQHCETCYPPTSRFTKARLQTELITNIKMNYSL